MKKILLLVITGVILFPLIISLRFVSCNKYESTAPVSSPNNIHQSVSGDLDPEYYEILLEFDVDRISLFEMQSDMTNRLITYLTNQKNYNISLFETAINLPDSSTVKWSMLADCFNMTTEELTYYNDKMRYLAGELQKKYHEFGTNIVDIERQCVSCDMQSVINNYKILVDQGYTPLQIVAKAPNCRWVPWTIGVILCAGSGPYLYWPCVYAVTCEFCKGGWVDEVCKPYRNLGVNN